MADTYRLLLANLRERARYRPDGYVDELLGCAILDGEFAVIQREVFDGLRLKYGGEPRRKRNAYANHTTAQGGCWAVNHGPAHWEKLHRRALLPVADEAAELDWLKGEYTAGIKCDHCKSHWVELLEKYPPIWGQYFAWTVDVHNILNDELSKPQMSIAAARQRWS